MESSYQHYYLSVFNKIDLSNHECLEGELNNILEANSKYSGTTTTKNEINDLLISKYIEEVWISELSDRCEGVDKPTITDYLVETKGLVRPYEKDIDIRLWTKLRNIYFALKQYLIPDEEEYEYDFIKRKKPVRVILSVDLIKQIHSIIGKDIIEDAGSFRKKNVCGLSSSVIYATAKTIPERLEELIYFFNSMITEVNEEDRDRDRDQRKKDRLLFMIALGSFFFSEFLLIHPFINGNGRTARILLNYILQSEVSFPFSIYLDGGDRDRCGVGGDRDRCGRRKYLDAVEKRNYDKHPTEITKYILHACNRSASIINWVSTSNGMATSNAMDDTDIRSMNNPLHSINSNDNNLSRK